MGKQEWELVSRRRNKNKQKKRQRDSTPLAQHRRRKKTLVPPLLDLAPISSVSYTREYLPDLLWVAAMLDGQGLWDAAYEPLDIVEEICGEAPAEAADKRLGEVIDGRLSAFALVPEERREDVRIALAEQTPWALRDELGHALRLYPECPASWLFESWRRENTVDADRGLRYLKQLVRAHAPRSGVEGTQIRMVPIARRGKAGVLSAPRELVAEWAKYPSRLDEEGRKAVEATMRATYSALAGADRASGAADVGHAWAEYFWRHSWTISACEFAAEEYVPDEDSDDDFDEDVPRTSALRIESVHGAWVAAMRRLGDALRERQMRAEMDLWEPISDEVRLGLASRAFRLAYELIDDPNLWAAAGAAQTVRLLIDTRIVVSWLLKKNEPALYERFRDYGLGKAKLYKLHLEDYIDELGEDPDLAKLRETLDREVNAEILEEFQRIDLGGTFSGMSIRNMAEEADLKPLYTLNYQPLSAEAHGEWTSLRRHDLDVCTNPLHRQHRVGAFSGPRLAGSIALVQIAFGYARDTIEDVFGHYGIDVEDVFGTCVQEMSVAVSQATDQPNQLAKPR